MKVKQLVRQIDAVIERWPPLREPLDPSIANWADLHWWDVSAQKYQRLLLRQAAFGALLRQVSDTSGWRAHPTPLDSLDLSVPPSLAEAARRAAENSQSTIFNFWGELYNVLIPQPARRYAGQFWTDEIIAEWMVAWLLQFHPQRLADIGCGAGNFLLKAAQLLSRTNSATELYGCDLSPLLLNATMAAFTARRCEISLLSPRLAALDFVTAHLPWSADAIVCNPPYTRHHDIAPATKDRLQAYFKKHLLCDVSRQSTLAFYFLLKTIVEMPERAHAAVIVPMEVLDARYGKAARRTLCQQTTLSAVVHFSPEMNAFHKVDVGASILFFKKGRAEENEVRHLTLTALPTTDDLLACLQSDGEQPRFGSLVIQPQAELLQLPKWFSIATPETVKPDWERSGLVVPLKALAKVMRGIATGANDFFVLSNDEVRRLSLESYVVRTLHRNREIQDIILDEARWQSLLDAGKRVWLLYLNGEDTRADPQLRHYLSRGEAAGYHRRSLVQTRKTWYMMEQREIPAIFFTILTRGNPRFILNRAGVRPVNMFSLLYPAAGVVQAGATEILWALLNSNFSLSRLHSVSRTYGGNTLKVEPGELANLPVINPLALPQEVGKQIETWIADYHHHQQSATLLGQVNKLVRDLLNSPNVDRYSSPLPTQLRLLDADDGHYDSGSAGPTHTAAQ